METKLETKQLGTPIKITVAVTYLIMIAVNAMANILPINGIDTGAVSDSYPNLFAPAGLTFSIWGVIYLLLLGYTLYQFGIFQGDKSKVKTELLRKVGIVFSASSVVNAAWIFSWHYRMIGLSVILMLVILLSLIYINQLILKGKLDQKEKLFIRLPFSVYFGWITVATIANITTLLVDIGWNGFGISESIWTILIIIIGLAIGAVTMIRNHDIAYGLVIIWAYAGILIKHMSQDGFAGQYKGIITTVIACIVLMGVAIGYVLFAKKQAPSVLK
ncbi:MAG: tryptophan-rich sensory protein [Trichococcus sp.]